MAFDQEWYSGVASVPRKVPVVSEEFEVPGRIVVDVQVVVAMTCVWAFEAVV